MAQTTTVIGRAKFANPDLGFDVTDGGTALHAALTAMHTAAANHLTGRWFTAQTINNGSYLDFTHNFGLTSADDLTVFLYESNTEIAPTGFSFTAQSSDVLRISNASGGNKTLNVLILANASMTKGSQTFTGVKSFATSIAVNTINEYTSASGVSIDGVTCKDNSVRAPSGVYADNIYENTSNSGVTIDSVKLKDGVTLATSYHKPSFRRKVVVFGSSVALGIGATDNHGWAYKLGLDLVGKGYEFANASVGGDTTALLISRFYTDLVPTNPTCVIIALSLANEGLASAVGIAAKQAVYNTYVSNIYKLVSMCREQGYSAVVTSCYPYNTYSADDYVFVRAFNNEMEASDIPFIDYTGCLDDGSGHWHSGLDVGDGLHPNDDGHTVMYNQIQQDLFDNLDASKGVHRLPDFTDDTSIEIPAAATYAIECPISSKSVTAMCWVKSTSTLTTGKSILQIVDTDSAAASTRIRNNLSVYSLVVKNATPNSFDSTVDSLDNEWHHVALTFNEHTQKTAFYVDGALVGEATDTSTDIIKVIFGGRVDGTVAAIGMKFKEMAMYSTVLNAKQILDCYKGRYKKGSLSVLSPIIDHAQVSSGHMQNINQMSSVRMTDKLSSPTIHTEGKFDLRRGEGKPASTASVILSAESPEVLYLTPSGAAISQNLPTTNVKIGKRFTIIVSGASVTNYVAVNSSGSNEIYRITDNGAVSVVALQDAPTTAAHWKVVAFADNKISVDTINEFTSATGVTIDSVKLKDGNIEATSGSGIKIKDDGGNDCISCADGGAVTVGPNSTHTYAGPVNKVNGGIWAASNNGSDGSGTFTIGSNAFLTGGAPSYAGRINTATTGAAVQFHTRTSVNTNDAVSFWTNKYNDAVDTASIKVMSITTEGAVTITGDTLILATAKTPASASASGTTGQICWDANFFYVCTATNTWKRAAIATW